MLALKIFNLKLELLNKMVKENTEANNKKISKLEMNTRMEMYT